MDRRDVLRRALVVFTLGPLTLFLIYLGDWPYFLSFAALLTIATIEATQLLRKLGWHVQIALVLPLVLAFWIVPGPVQLLLFGDRILDYDFVPIVILFVLLTTLFMSLWLYEKRVEQDAPGSWFATAGIVFVLGWLGSHFFILRSLPEAAIQWTSLAMIGTWISDSGAYIIGKSFGKHKIAPRLSPNKTVEGYLGGIFIGILFTALLGYLLKLPLIMAIILGVLVSVVSPLGDFGVSLLKRSVGVKDSGNLLPGHGGALDRIDSLIWSVTFAYYLVLFVGLR